MSHTIVLELSNEDFMPIRQVAEATGRTPAEVMVATLRQHPPRIEEPARPSPTNQLAAARARTAADIQAAIRTTAEEMAARTGRTPEEIIAELRASIAPKSPVLTEAERQAGW